MLGFTLFSGKLMLRRDFITLLGGAAALRPLVVRAEQIGKLPTVGVFVAGTPESHGNWVAAFVQRLRELGWIEGRTVAIEYRWAEGRTERFAEIAAEFVRLKVDVIFTSVTGAVIAAKQATSVTPIVFTTVTDPVISGLVASIPRPGGNVTGLSQQTSGLGGKRLGLLHEIVPRLRRVAVLANITNPSTKAETSEISAAARMLGLEIVPIEVRRSEDIAPGIKSLQGEAEALYVLTDPLVAVNQIEINTLALDAQLPTMHGLREYVVSGGLISYGANFPDLFRRAADYVDKILRGTKPADLPVEQPTKFDLIVSMKTARALGLTLPATLLASADEVIE
jgi:putative tryptophan/tyrosine transport system substrate-binding protein